MPRRLALLLTVTLMVAACSDGARDPTSPAEPVGEPLAAAVASNTWLTRATMPGTERWFLASTMVPNAAGQSILYAIGGKTSPSETEGGGLSKVMAYNVATNTWTTKAPLPVPLYYTNGAVVINGKIYVTGGYTTIHRPLKSTYVYDPAKNTWTRKRDMPKVSYGGISGAIGGKLYVLAMCNRPGDCGGTSLYQFSRYNPATDRWAALPLPPDSTVWAGGVVAAKFISAHPRGNHQIYDPATNRWTFRPEPQLVQRGMGAALAGKLYVIDWAVSVYTAASDTWADRGRIPRFSANGSFRTRLTAAKVVRDGQARIELVGGYKPDNNLQYVP